MSNKECSTPTPPELVCFDVRLEHGLLTASVGVTEALQITNWLYAMGWVDRDFRDCMFGSLRGGAE
jgi:hypothetical protein